MNLHNEEEKNYKPHCISAAVSSIWLVQNQEEEVQNNH